MTATTTSVTEPATSPVPRFGVVARLLHWTMAVLVVFMLFLGATLVGALGNYPRALLLHESVGIAILVLALIRIGNRLRRSPPPPPASIAKPERIVATASEFLMYVLFVTQPIVGWALVSASGIPIHVFGGLRLPAITPTNAYLYHVLRELHAVLAFALLAVFVAHMCAVLAHTLILHDRLLSRMLFPLRPRDPRSERTKLAAQQRHGAAAADEPTETPPAPSADIDGST
ncbi:cytochrome b/b6 domain-containing protein [Nocardia callitridis]|uniref:Cytochrome b/b6 domain-containing protein n=1 Tax=Nocardia callitridis TaxID=648753 RepID=A0ABP9KEA0_9NOCA